MGIAQTPTGKIVNNKIKEDIGLLSLMLFDSYSNKWGWVDNMELDGNRARMHETILLVDDEDMVRHVCTMMLERLGYSVVAGRNGAEALGLFQENPDAFDVVVTDIQMPQMSGTDLARNIRSFGSDVPIILITGFGLDVPSDFMSTANIFKFVMKPIDMLLMAKIVRQALDSRPENHKKADDQGCDHNNRSNGKH